MATIQEVADRVGITKGVVSSYLNNPDTSRVSAATKAKIDAAVEDLGYARNIHARNLSRQTSDLINVLVLFREPLFRNSVVNEVLSGAATHLGTHDYGLVFPAQRSGTLLEMTRDQIRGTHGNAGYILIGTRYTTSEDLERTVTELERRRVPFVITNMPQLDRAVNQVLIHTDRAAAAIRNLNELGHERILVLGGTGYDPEGTYELDLVRNTLEALGVEPDPNFIHFADYDFRKAKDAVAAAIERGEQFTAIFCLARQMAMGAAQALADKGMRVPEDITVSTIAESRFTDYYNFPFVVTETDYYRMGEEAARLLATELDCRRKGVPYRPQAVRIESKLVIGHSIRALAPKEPSNG